MDAGVVSLPSEGVEDWEGVPTNSFAGVKSDLTTRSGHSSMVERRGTMPGWGAMPSIVDFDTVSCVVPLLSGFAGWEYEICFDCFQGHQANMLCSQFLIVCLNFIFLPPIY